MLLARRPDLVLVVGDVNSTLACSLAAVKLGIPVAHVEAGLRSFDRTMPEEINRVVTDALAELLFVTEAAGVENLRKEGIASVPRPLRRQRHDRHAARPPRRGTADATSSSGWGSRAGALCGADAPPAGQRRRARRAAPRSSSRSPSLRARCRSSFPFTRARARRSTVDAPLVAAEAGVRLIDPVGYLEFVRLMSDARLVLTDSGGIQEETTILGVDCVTLRDNTERPVTVEHGTNRIGGTTSAGIRAAIEAALAATARRGLPAAALGRPGRGAHRFRP